MHSVHSDGSLTPEQLAAGARAAGLDVLATAELYTAGAHGAWHGQVGDERVVILGAEGATRS
ncbi:phosphoesterase, partial [Streptomyces sp. NPDC059802]